jgi:hypothetical protein
MAPKTVEDLEALRAKLIIRRRREAYGVYDAPVDERIAKLVHVHLAIGALDQVIDEGEEEPPEPDVPSLVG